MIKTTQDIFPTFRFEDYAGKYPSSIFSGAYFMGMSVLDIFAGMPVQIRGQWHKLKMDAGQKMIGDQTIVAGRVFRKLAIIAE